MKIFVGGMKKHHQENFRRLFPDVTFTFATFEDAGTKWIARANAADACVIDQSRCDHTKVDMLRKYVRPPIYFTDRKPHMKVIIQELITNGKAGYSYTGIPGSEGALGSCQWATG